MTAFRSHDDNEGDPAQGIEIWIDPMGDVHLAARGGGLRQYLRFRTIQGGGESPHTHAALIALKAAMEKDNQSRIGS